MIDSSNVFGVNVHQTKKFKSFVFDNRNFSIEDLVSQIEDLNKISDSSVLSIKHFKT